VDGFEAGIAMDYYWFCPVLQLMFLLGGIIAKGIKFKKKKKINKEDISRR
jgi:hypothetical protein